MDQKIKKILPEKVPVNAPFVEKSQNIIRTTLYIFSRPFKALQTDIAYIGFLARSAVNKKRDNFDVDDDNEDTHEKKTNNKTNKKPKKKGINNYLNK